MKVKLIHEDTKEHIATLHMDNRPMKGETIAFVTDAEYQPIDGPTIEDKEPCINKQIQFVEVKHVTHMCIVDGQSLVVLVNKISKKYEKSV